MQAGNGIFQAETAECKSGGGNRSYGTIEDTQPKDIEHRDRQEIEEAGYPRCDRIPCPGHAKGKSQEKREERSVRTVRLPQRVGAIG